LKKNNIIEQKSFEFALRIVDLSKLLVNEKEFVISKQLLKSGTSIGANVNESISAVSKKDFINKLSIAVKEARETKYWLRLLQESNLIKLNFTETLYDVEELIKILSSIIKTSKSNL